MRKTLTYGLTHLAVTVADLGRTKAFYCAVFDMEVMYDDPGFLQLTTPGCHDILVFEPGPAKKAGAVGGIAHFGFRLRAAGEISAMRAKILKAGGVIQDEGEFVPGSPYIFFKDPDGYLVEVWFEMLS